MPRRRLLPDKGSQIRLDQFPSLRKSMHALLTEEVRNWKPIEVPPGRHTRPLNPALIDYLQKRIDTITDDDFATIAYDLQGYAVNASAAAADDPEAWIDDTLQRAGVLADDHIVRPLIEAVRATLVRNADDPEDRAFDLEATLITKLTEGLTQTLPGALNDYATTQSIAPVEAVLAAELDPAGCRGILKDAAQQFWTADALGQVRELVSYIDTGENLQAYLYVGTVNYRSQTYPLFYLPITITHGDPSIALHLEPHLYVNRQALEYILQVSSPIAPPSSLQFAIASFTLAPSRSLQMPSMRWPQPRLPHSACRVRSRCRQLLPNKKAPSKSLCETNSSSRRSTAPTRHSSTTTSKSWPQRKAAATP